MAHDALDLSFSDDSNDTDGRLADLLAEYLERHASGESITEDVVRSEHPEEAAELLPELRALQALSSESEDPRAPRRLGDYRLVRRIGRGGMGVVYEAVQESMDRRVALKVLPSGVLGDSRNLSRFIREAKIAGQLHHPNIVPVHALGAEADSPYFAMEYVDGDTLARVVSRLRKSRDKPEAERNRVLSGVLRRFRSSEVDTGVGARKVEDSSASSSTDASNDLPVTALDADEVTPAYCYRLADAFAAVAEGLQHAHARGIIHRDIKPSNLILDRDGRVRILDFGLARREGQQGLTLTGDLIGTVLYMSPEQAMARQAGVDHLTDIYSLGATLYELLAWHPPFEGKDYHDTLGQIVSKEARPLRSVNARIPADLETIVSKCMRKAPTERYRSAEALAQDLRRFVRGDAVEARRRTPLEKFTQSAWKHRRKGLVATITIALLVSVAWIAIKAQRDDYVRREAEYAPKVLGALRRMRLSQISGREGVPYRVGMYPWGFRFVGDLRGELRPLVEEGGIDPLRDAVAELSEAITSLPERVDAYWHRARARLFLGDENAALDDLAHAIRIDPGLVPALLLRAEILARRREHDAAASLKRQAKEEAKDEDGWAAGWLAGQRFSWRREWSKAADAFERSLASVDAGTEPYVGWELETSLARGLALLRGKRPFDALLEVAVVRSEWPEAADVALIEGAVFLSLDETDRAEEQFERLYEGGPFQGEIAMAVKVMYALADPERREGPEEMEMPSKWNDRRPSPLRELGRAWTLQMKMSETTKAVAELAKVLELAPDHAPLLREVGRTYFAFARMSGSIGLANESATVLRKSLEIEPDSGLGKVRLGQTLAMIAQRSQNPEKRAEALELAGLVEESNPELSFEIARIYLEIGDLDRAHTLFDDALEHEMHAPIACYNAKARVLWQLALREEGPRRIDLLGSALEALRNSIPMNPPYLTPRRRRASILLELDQHAEAFTEFRRILEFDAGDEISHSQLRRLLALSPEVELGDNPERLRQRLAEIGRHAEAFAELRRTLELDAGDEISHSQLRGLLTISPEVELDDDPERLAELLEKMPDYPNRPEVLERVLTTLAEVQRYLGLEAAANETDGRVAAPRRRVFLPSADGLGEPTEARLPRLVALTCAGDEDDEWVVSLQPSGDGGFVVSGTATPRNGRSDLFLAKFDSESDLSWERTYGGEDTAETGGVLQQTSDGGWIVAGAAAAKPPGSGNLVYLMRTDSDGVLVWERTLGGFEHYRAYDVRQTRDGGFVLTGYVGEWSEAETFLARTDSQGALLWEKTFGQKGFAYGMTVAETEDGGFTVAGWANTEKNRGNLYLATTDSGGGVVQERTVGLSSAFRNVELLPDGGFIVVGSARATDGASDDLYLARIDVEGDVVWEQLYGGERDESGSSVTGTADGGFLVSGTTKLVHDQFADGYVLEVDSRGNLLWQARFGGTGDERAIAVQPTANGGCVVAGHTSSIGRGSKDAYLLELRR